MFILVNWGNSLFFLLHVTCKEIAFHATIFSVEGHLRIVECRKHRFEVPFVDNLKLLVALVVVIKM